MRTGSMPTRARMKRCMLGVKAHYCCQGDWEYEEEPEVPRKEVQGPYCKTPVTWPLSAQTEKAAAMLADWIQLMRNR